MKCPHLGCEVIIAGWTGLDELNLLRSHFYFAHGKNIDMKEAMYQRSIAERIEKVVQEKLRIPDESLEERKINRGGLMHN